MDGDRNTNNVTDRTDTVTASAHIACLGLDLGSVNVRGVLLVDGRPMWIGCRPVRGRLIDAVRRLLDELVPQHLEPDQRVRVQVTGVGRDLLHQERRIPICNEIVALGDGARRICPDARSVFEIGGHTSRWVALDAAGEIEDYALSEACAAGTGAFIEQQASRMQLDPAGLSTAAMAARRGAVVAGRCSVFAKTDMIHLQQKGVPTEEIAYGLCLAVARNVVATLLKGRQIPRPVALTGGASANRGLVRALAEVLELKTDLIVPPLAGTCSALGAASTVARGLAKGQETVVVGDLLGQLNHAEQQDMAARAADIGLPCLEAAQESGLAEPTFTEATEGRTESKGDGVEAYLGVDVGSVSTNLVVMDDQCQVLDGIYLPTRGRPVEVLRQGLSMLKERFGADLRVLALGATGSGRHLAAGVLGADVVQNEITCQLASTLHYVPDVDTIIEIGGQDSKYIQAAQGRLVDFTMNKICAAGTGSFLEEEAQRLGISIEEQFAELALEAERPVNLGCRCTVFIDTEVVNALAREATLPDLCAGLAYAIARNYLDRVVERRSLGRRVVMQGGVASNRAVVSAFSGLLGRAVQVHPHNRISGAIGAALAARANRREQPTTPSMFRGLSALDERYEVKSFECHHCENRCQVSQFRIDGKRAHFGDACERYASTDNRRDVSDLPDLFSEREALLREVPAPVRGRGATIGLPWTSFFQAQYPFWATLLSQLGFTVQPSPKTTPRTLEMGSRHLPAETCLPVKLAFGHVHHLLQQGVDAVFFPSLSRVASLEHREDQSSGLCPYTQSLPFMLSAGLPGARLLVPELELVNDLDQMVPELQRVLGPFGGTEPVRIRHALVAALAVQRGAQAWMRNRGAEVLSSAKQPIRVAVLGRPYHLADSFLNLNLARHARRLGMLILPMDMLPVGSEESREGEQHVTRTMPWRYSQDIQDVMIWLVHQVGLFPILLSSFGCGPDAFAIKQLKEMMGGRPHLELELDEHRAEAGLITRLEAFIEEISQYEASRTEGQRISSIGPEVGKPSDCRHYLGRRIFVPYLADHMHAFTGALQSAGLDARLLPEPDEALVARAESCSSGKECHPYAMIAADLDRLVDHHRPGDVFLVPGSTLPCLVQQYGPAMAQHLKERGIDDLELLTPNVRLFKDLLGYPRTFMLNCGLFAVDLLVRMTCALRPYEREPGLTDALHRLNLRDLERGLAQGELRQALQRCVRRLSEVEVDRSSPRPLVGVAGDIYTRINHTANRRLFSYLEQQGCEVWPAPFLVDILEYGLTEDLIESLRRG